MSAIKAGDLVIFHDSRRLRNVVLRVHGVERAADGREIVVVFDPVCDCCDPYGAIDARHVTVVTPRSTTPILPSGPSSKQ
jgi:hypothetical protein